MISKDGAGYKGIVTNDYYTKTAATHSYEMETFLSQNSYYGNIVWNLPNATYIKLKENAPFAGHLIAPNADVETPELHFAGSFIVNSLYGEGNTEAHFYPITVSEKCVCDDYDRMSAKQKERFAKFMLAHALGAEKTTIEKTVEGNQATYDQEKALFERTLAKCGTDEVTEQAKTVHSAKNPQTNDRIITSIIVAASGVIISTYIFKRQKMNR